MSNALDSFLPKTLKLVRSFQGIEEYILDNGLKVLLFEDISQSNVTVNITYLVGSRHEGRGEAGMAHLLEHMLFRGTSSLKDVKGALQDKGANFNATTWFDRTNYFATYASAESLEFALSLEADRMINSLISAEDLESEMTVVRNEFEMGENNPVHVLHDQLMSAAFRWHNYGKTTIGNRSDIERVPASSLRRFYEHYYQPDNAVLVVAGLFEKNVAIDLIERYFGAIARPERSLDKTYTEEPAQDGPREVVVERVGDMASVGVGYHIPASSHPDHAAIRVFIDAITDEPGGLLYKELVETGLCSELFGITYFLYEPGMALCFTRPTSEAQTLEIRNKLIELIEQKAASSLDEQHVARIRARMLKRFKLALTNSKDVALKLSEAIACGDWRLFFWQRQQTETVTLADVVRVSNLYFVRSNRTSGIFLPQKQAERIAVLPVPSIEEVLQNLKEDNSQKAGEAFVATTENIERLVVRKQLSAYQKSAFLPKKTRGEAVNVRLLLGYGNEEVLNPYREELYVLPALMWRGSELSDFQGLRDRLDSLMSTLELSGEIGRLSASVKSERAYILNAIELLSEMVRRPSFKSQEFSIVKQREIDDLEEVKNDPQRLGFHELDRLKSPWPKESIHYVPSFEEKILSLRGLSLDRIKESHHKIFSCENWCISLLGDADGDLLLNKVPELFSEPREKVLFERIKRPFIANVVEERSLHTPDKEMAIIAMGTNFPMRDDNEDFAAVKLANYMFGETMNSRLFSRIREKEGISYGAGSWIEVSRYEENASINMYAMAAPPSISRARTAMQEEWQRFLDDGPKDDELSNAKESFWLMFKNLLSSDSYVVNTLASDLESERNFMWREQLFKKMRELSRDDIKKALERWWQNAKFSVVIAGDQTKIK